jgi:hypothetical protein
MSTFWAVLLTVIEAVFFTYLFGHVSLAVALTFLLIAISEFTISFYNGVKWSKSCLAS